MSTHNIYTKKEKIVKLQFQVKYLNDLNEKLKDEINHLKLISDPVYIENLNNINSNLIYQYDKKISNIEERYKKKVIKLERTIQHLNNTIKNKSKKLEKYEL